MGNDMTRMSESRKGRSQSSANCYAIFHRDGAVATLVVPIMGKDNILPVGFDRIKL